MGATRTVWRIRTTADMRWCHANGKMLEYATSEEARKSRDETWGRRGTHAVVKVKVTVLPRRYRPSLSALRDAVIFWVRKLRPARHRGACAECVCDSCELYKALDALADRESPRG